jgi:hypothetical protein
MAPVPAQNFYQHVIDTEAWIKHYRLVFTDEYQSDKVWITQVRFIYMNIITHTKGIVLPRLEATLYNSSAGGIFVQDLLCVNFCFYFLFFKSQQNTNQ